MARQTLNPQGLSQLTAILGQQAAVQNSARQQAILNLIAQQQNIQQTLERFAARNKQREDKKDAERRRKRGALISGAGAILGGLGGAALAAPIAGGFGTAIPGLAGGLTTLQAAGIGAGLGGTLGGAFGGGSGLGSQLGSQLQGIDQLITQNQLFNTVNQNAQGYIDAINRLSQQENPVGPPASLQGGNFLGPLF